MPAFPARALAIAIALCMPVAANSAPPPVTAPPRTLPGLAAQSTTNAAPADGTTIVPAKPSILGRKGAEDVTIMPLGASEGAAVGLLDDTNGGLGGGIWSGTNRALAGDELARAPIATPLAALRDLGRRLLLTRAASPVGPAEYAFTTIRLRKLLEAGFIGDAAALAVQSEIGDDAQFARVQAEAILYAGDAAGACGTLTATRLVSADPFWIELRAYCYAMSGDSAALDLTRSVMDAQGLSDPGFDILLGNIQSKKTEAPGDIAAPTALDVFLLHRAGLPVDAALARKLGTAASLLAARDSLNPPQARLEAAQNIVSTGALTNDELASIADAQSFTAAQLSNALDLASTWPFLEGQALLRQAAMKESDASRKVQLVVEALQLGEKNGLFCIAAALAPIASVKPVHGAAGIMARALLLSGNADAAARWYDVPGSNPKAEQPSLAMFQAELNLAATNSAREIAAQQALQYLAGQMPQTATALTQDQANAALILGLYKALGETMPPDAQVAADLTAEFPWPGRRIAANSAQRLAAALKQPGRKGEAILIVLNAAGAGGPGDLAPDVTIGLVRALKHEGLGDAARGLALDALLLRRADA